MTKGKSGLRTALLGLGLIVLSCVTLSAQTNEFQDSWAVRFADSLMNRWPRMNDLDNSWSYEAGFVLHGIQQVYNLTGDEKYLKYINDFVNSQMRSDGSISYSSGNLDDYLASRQLLFLYETTGEEIYRTAASRFRNSLENMNRNASGGFWHKSKYPNQMWCDGIYMAMPFLIHYGSLFDDMDYALEEVQLQFTLLAEHAQDPESGLLYHAWDETRSASWADRTTGLSPEFWGRGLGWYAMALVDVLDYYPADEPGYQAILDILVKLVPGLAQVQDPSTGMWFQVLDKGQLSSNWVESSGTAMFVYAIHKAARLGYVDSSYLSVADTGWKGLLDNKVSENYDGYITLSANVNGMGVQTSYNGYINQRTLTNSHHGLGAFLMAATEILKTEADGTPTPLGTPGSTETPTPTPVRTPEIEDGIQGDVDSDGFVTIIDAMLIAQYYVGIFNVPINTAVADVNCGNTIDIVDALLAAQYYVGLLGELEACR